MLLHSPLAMMYFQMEPRPSKMEIRLRFSGILKYFLAQIIFSKRMALSITATPVQVVILVLVVPLEIMRRR